MSSSLVNQDVVDGRILKDEIYGPSHHAGPGFLGAGLLYYSLAYMWKAKLCVCLGSGSGFVPRIMRQAQQDLGLEGSRTILIDAELPGWGDPDYHDKPECFFRTEYDVEIWKKTTEESAPLLEGQKIDYLHIDADHSYEGVRSDFDRYMPLVAASRVVTLHDTLASNAGVFQLVEELRQDPAYDVLNLRIGIGVAVVKRREKIGVVA